MVAGLRGFRLNFEKLKGGKKLTSLLAKLLLFILFCIIIFIFS